MTFAQITHPDDVAANLEAARRMRAGEASEYNTEKRYIRKDGRTVWVNLNAAVIRDADGRAMRAVCTIQDVTDRKRAQWLEVDRSRTLEMVAKDMPLADVLGQLAGALERQVEGATAALMVLQDGTVLLEGPSLAADWREALAARCLTLAAGLALNLPDDSLGGCGVTFLGDHAVWTELRATARTHGLQTCWSVRFCSSDGTPLGLLSLFHSELRQPTLVELQALDMAAKLASICVEHHNSTRQLAHFVRHDPLTGLPNRMCFEDHLGKAMALARRSGKSVAVIVLDVDCFKEVNDSLGHDAGDALLQELAFRLRATLRESDTVARMGGDEFMMVLPDLPGPEGAALVANELLNCLKRPFLVGGQERVATSSMGIAISPRDGEDSATLQRRADEQMYVTKRRGRNGYSIR